MQTSSPGSEFQSQEMAFQATSWENRRDESLPQCAIEESLPNDSTDSTEEKGTGAASDKKMKDSCLKQGILISHARSKAC